MATKRIDSPRSPSAKPAGKRLPLVKQKDVAPEDKVRAVAGDSLSRIAVREGVKLNKLRQLNPELFSLEREQGDRIFPGDEVVLRSGGQPEAEAKKDWKPEAKKPKTGKAPPKVKEPAERKVSSHKLTDVELTGRTLPPKSEIEKDGFEPSKGGFEPNRPDPDEPVSVSPNEPEPVLTSPTPEPVPTTPVSSPPVSTVPVSTVPVCATPVQPNPSEPVAPHTFVPVDPVGTPELTVPVVPDPFSTRPVPTEPHVTVSPVPVLTSPVVPLPVPTTPAPVTEQPAVVPQTPVTTTLPPNLLPNVAPGMVPGVVPTPSRTQPVATVPLQPMHRDILEPRTSPRPFSPTPEPLRPASDMPILRGSTAGAVAPQVTTQPLVISPAPAPGSAVNTIATPSIAQPGLRVPPAAPLPRESPAAASTPAVERVAQPEPAMVAVPPPAAAPAPVVTTPASAVIPSTSSIPQTQVIVPNGAGTAAPAVLPQRVGPTAMPAVMMPAPPPGIGRLPTVAAPSPAPLIGRLPTATVPSPAPVIGRPVPVAPVPVTPTVPVAIPPGITLAVNPNVRKPLDVLLVQHNFRSVTADGRVTAAEGAALRSTMTQLSPEAQAEVKLRFRNSMSMFDPDARAPMQQFVNTSNALTATPAVLNFPTARPRLGGGTRLVLRADGASVTAARTGSMPEGTKKATLAWDKNNEADLAGYRVYLGSAPGVFTHVYEVASKDANSFSLEDLPAGTHFFALTAYDTTNNESAFSNAVSKTIP